MTAHQEADAGSEIELAEIACTDAGSTSWRPALWVLNLTFALIGTSPGCSASAASNTDPTVRGPRIELREQIHDFGDVLAPMKRTFVFRLTNVGDTVLEIDGISDTCSCTANVLSQRRIEPGGVAHVQVEFDPIGLHGLVERSVVVRSNDTERPRLRLTLTANIVRDANWEPRVLHLGRVPAGEGSSGDLVVWFRNGLDGRVIGVDTERAGLSARVVSDADARDDKTIIRVTLASTAPLGSLDSVLKVTTNIATDDPIRIEVMGNVYGSIERQPRSLQLSRDRHGIVRLRRANSRARPFGVVSVVSSAGAIHADVVPVGDSYDVRICVQQNSRRVSGKVIVTTDDDYQGIIEIPVSYIPPGFSAEEQ